jgi:hypothetical protein
VESTAASESFGRVEEPIQAMARRVLGPLRKEVVRGIAASKGASACWTNTDVYTWGTNNGQLGIAHGLCNYSSLNPLNRLRQSGSTSSDPSS